MSLLLIGSIISILSLYYLLPKKIVINLLNRYYPQILTHKDSENIFITIDNVPYGYHKEILNLLDFYNYKSNLFVIANQYAKENKQVLIDAVKNGHRLCNHGISNSMHILKSEDELKREILECDKFIKEIYKEANVEMDDKKYYRPSCGYFSKNMIRIVEKLGYKMALGSVYPHDQQIMSGDINYYYIIGKIERGDILIIHDRKWTIDLLKKLLPWLKEHGIGSEIL